MATYRALFAFPEYRSLYGAQTLSYLGDQIGAIAVAVLVFDQTGSGLLTAVAYAAGGLPGVLGGPVLAAYADRLPRRTVMITCDLVRAALLALLIIPGIPVWAAIGVLYVAHLCSPPFSAARSALMPDVLPGDLYVLGNGLGNITFQVCQLVGFAAGGLVVALIGPAPVLLANAVTFVLSAALVVRVRPRPALPPVTLPAGTNSVVNFGTTGCDTTTNSGATPTPVRWSVVAGSIPTGMSGPNFQGSTGGNIIGIPSVPGTYHFTLQVTDQIGATDQENVTVTVA